MAVPQPVVLYGTWRNKDCVVFIRSAAEVYASDPEVSGILMVAVHFETFFDADPQPARQTVLDPSDPVQIAAFLDSLTHWETISVEPTDVFPAAPSPAQDDIPGLVY